MRALVYHGPGAKAWEEVPKPELVEDTDAIVRVDATKSAGFMPRAKDARTS